MCDLGDAKSTFYAKQPITAYRIFRKFGKSLKSVYQDTRYSSEFPFYEAKGYGNGMSMFLSRKANIQTFTRDGFYAFRSLNRTRNWAKGWLGSRVVARVLLFGKIVRHQYGYRSEFMFIDKILS